MTYFLLIRRISPYTHANILLGVFSSEKNAIKTKKIYYNQCHIEVPQNPQPKSPLKKTFIEKIFGLSQPKKTPKTMINMSHDPWYHQSYKEDGLVLEDLVVEEMSIDEDYNSKAVLEMFVVSYYFDSMGMINREFDSLHITQMSATQRLETLIEKSEDTDSLKDFPPNRFSIQKTYVNALLSDDPRNQPKLR